MEVDGEGASSKKSSTVNLSCSGCIPDTKRPALLAFNAYTGSTSSKHGYRKASQGAKRSPLSVADNSQATLIFGEQANACELVGCPACSCTKSRHDLDACLFVFYLTNELRND